MSVRVDTTLRQTLRIAGIMVGYDGPMSTAPNAPNLQLPLPTLNNLQNTAAITLLMFPVENLARVRGAGNIIWNLPLNDAPSCSDCCTPNWIALNTALAAQKTANGNHSDVLYYGLLNQNIQMGPVIGCESGV